MSIRVLIKDQPQKAIALATSTHVLIFRHSPTTTPEIANNSSRNASQVSLSSTSAVPPRCMVEFSTLEAAELTDFRSLSTLSAHGTLGLITVNNDVFLCVVSGTSKVATVRPGETIQRILAVEFHCLSSSDYDNLLNDEINPYPTDTIDDEGFEHGYSHGRREHLLEHPCLALKKLLSSGTFYYSAEFDVTRRLQDRSSDAVTVSIDSLDAGFLWNSYMIQPLVDFRSRLHQHDRDALDSSQILTSAIRGFALTIAVPASSSPARTNRIGLPSNLTLISRLSCRRAGTRFNARGIDDDGNVANFVESETVFWTPSGLCFSYVQVRGSVPLFWEQTAGLLPGQQKISITRSPEANQPAFDKHFDRLAVRYGAVHVVNLLSNEKPGELELSTRYRYHVEHSSLNFGEKDDTAGHELLKMTDYDFHAETRGPGGYEAASLIVRYIQDSVEGFAYYLQEVIEDRPKTGEGGDEQVIRRPVTVLQQEGIFRVNCLDCLDRTNLVQTIISRLALESCLDHRGERGNSDFWIRHGSLWADNGDALSRIYAGTGALKSSFTRHGKMSLAGALADARKSATRMYINNFADKGRQNTIDMLLGRLVGQAPVHLYDPINDYVTSELAKRAAEYSSSETIHIWTGTFNLNGRTDGIHEDLSSWLCPPVGASQEFPELVAVGFQEIVELSPQQIMSTDPARRQAWESAVKKTLNTNAQKHSHEEYVLLRGGQLVGASLSIFVKASALGSIKNVEGSLKKTGMSGMAGNKGAVAIRMEYANTSLCFVTAHLAAGFANYDERNRDYHTISHGLRFQRNQSIDDHDAVIWLGDFNYRIGLNNEKVRKLAEIGDFERLYENDQLNIQMVAGLTFPYYAEARITFPPTYRYDLGTDRYDTSEKARIPAWCDRILRKGGILRQINYNSAPLRFSDHRPVYATFQCTISTIDEKKRDELRSQMYRQRRGAVADITANGGTDDEDEDDLIGYDSIEPGLPPASSDRRKWWLDNGLPARSKIHPPGDNFIVNPNRPSNPFTPTNEPDWVHVQHPNGTSDGVRRTQTVPSRPEQQPRQPAVRKLPPPFEASQTSPHQSLRDFDGQKDDRVPIVRTLSGASTASMPNSLNRKPAPPVPKKPTLLSKAAPLVAGQAGPTSRQLTATSSSPVGEPASTPSRRSATLRKPAPQPLPGPELAEAGPPLPPRRTTEQLMDNDDEGAVDGLKGWEVLKPSR
ncbi:Inositol-1,4,5-trisphosphate 5-phosphatase 1 [Coniosporium apollinis]|uniref:phosphoinositide 5-phosphatase n=1 Tax=Coniosporium apollinis TaxID=61459 RepID=A0ABQ9NT64_9PEZI|nr:Inositol-1,4,5-trisphosphate 5-phosphatase 1 [Coniosporium apollinis]